ncbi:MAG TPA: hypothetical protein VNW54_05480 [Granulicella sp.]|jgi:hypothetical protein|nr:hypothetical protein [Granulicella sp.]
MSFDPNTISNETTVGELRQHYGEHFAAGYGNTDKFGHVLGCAGVATLGEYLRHHDLPPSPPPPHQSV